MELNSTRISLLDRTSATSNLQTTGLLILTTNYFRKKLLRKPAPSTPPSSYCCGIIKQLVRDLLSSKYPTYGCCFICRVTVLKDKEANPCERRLELWLC